MPPARDLGRGRFAPQLLEAIDRCLRLRGTERIQGSRELLEAFPAKGDQSPSAVSVDDSEPSTKRAVAVGMGEKSGSGATVPEPRNAKRWAGWMAFTGWWSQGSRKHPWVRDWDALAGGIEDPGFATAAQVYIARYQGIPEAGVWVARAEGLMAKLKELEAAVRTPEPYDFHSRPSGKLTELEAVDRTRREVGESLTNSLGMEFIWIEAGRFLMGSPVDEEGRNADELQHEVRISEGFWMGKYEVTQGEWQSVMGANPSFYKDCGPLCPVDSVSWIDAEEFIRRLNGRESGRGYRYRLPTEAEWEYAARAGTTGARYGVLDLIAWYGDNSGFETHPVGQKRANAWGLHDMLGNVWEWTGDRYGRYPSGSVTDPQGPPAGSGRVIRGGGWLNFAGYVRSAYRGPYSPGFRHIGFRLIRTK